MADIRTHEQVVGIVCTLAMEAHNDAEQEREEYGTQTRQAMRWLEETDLALRFELATAMRERGEALRTVKALTPAANYCLEYKQLLLKAEHERDEAIRVLRDIATSGWYAKGAKVARAYLAAREGR